MKSAEQLRELARLAGELADDRAFLDAVDDAAARVVVCLEQGGKVLTCGNGGSATDACHLAEELVGRYRADGPALPAISLAADGSVLTCIANDFGFDAVFARQVEAHGAPGDVLVAFTTSGTSPNIVRALESAKTKGLTTIAVTGKDGGPARTIADLNVHVPHAASERIQEIHTFVLHAICEAVERRFRSK